MKKQFTLIIALAISLNILAQNVGIGTTSPNANAALDINDNSRFAYTTDGFCCPQKYPQHKRLDGV